MNNSNKAGSMRMYFLSWILLSTLLVAACASTSLQRAIYQNDQKLVKELLAEGEDVNKHYSGAVTPLMIATRQGNLEIVKILLHNGADIQARNEYGWSSLMIASRYGYPEIVEYLLDNGAYVHTRNHQDYTPLMLAAWGGHLEIVKILAGRDVRLDVRNKRGKTAVYYAALNKREDMVKHLIQKGARVESFQNDGDDLFATAVIYKMLATLNEDNEDFRKAEKNYRTAADWFERAGPKLIELADSYGRKQAGGVILSILGLVASTSDLANLESGNPTHYSDYVPQVEAERMSALQIMESMYRKKSEECKDECSRCRSRTDLLHEKNNK